MISNTDERQEIEKTVETCLGQFPTNDQKLMAIQIDLLLDIREALTKSKVKTTLLHHDDEA